MFFGYIESRETSKYQTGCFIFLNFKLQGPVEYIAGVGKLFTRKVRFGNTVEAAGRTLIGKQGEDLFLEITVHVRMLV